MAETEQARGITWYKDQTIRTLSNVYNLLGFKSKYTGKSFKGIKWGYDNTILKKKHEKPVFDMQERLWRDSDGSRDFRVNLARDNGY